MSKRDVDLADLGLDEPLDVASEIEARRILDQAAADTAAKAAAEERRLQLIAEQELNAQIAADMVRYKAILISTSTLPPSQNFEIIDSDGGAEAFFASRNGDAGQAFKRAKDRLREIAFTMHADAVINCQFDYRVFMDQNKLADITNQLLGSNMRSVGQCIEIFAYGTAVRLK